MRIESETTSEPEDERSLDRLLGEACWPDADPAAMARLRTTLAGRSLRISAKSGWRWGVAVAAGVMIALIGGAILLHQNRNPAPITQRQAAPMQVVAVSSSPTASAIVARPANEYECAVLLAHSAPTLIADNPTPNAPPTNPPAAIASSTRKNDPTTLLSQNDPASIGKFLQLVDDASTRNAALNALRNADQPPVELLLAELSAPLVSQRYAAARARGCLCHGPTFAALQLRVERNVDRREAMIALLYCTNPAAKEYLSQLRTRPVLRDMLISAQAQSREIF